MVSSWTSARNCAEVYNNAIAKTELQHLLPADWLRLKLDVELVWDSLFLHWLLEDCAENGITLELDHNCSHKERVSKGLAARNMRFVGAGQPEWNHACDLCCWLTKDEDGAPAAIRSAVVDGVTVGRPCCGVHDCTNPLPSVKSRFCHEHDRLNTQCCVTTCTTTVELRFQTCADPRHRGLETWVHEQNKAMFQLKHCLSKLGGSNQRNTHEDGSPNYNVEGNEEIDIYDIECEGKHNSGNCRVKVCFGRRHTHNEELVVGSCGVILGRATFYGSEASNGVWIFLKGVFPTKVSLPQVIWHDNNCKVQGMLRADPDPAELASFEHCAMPVDVFHFKSKHKESDTACNTFCNPANWQELMTDNGKWHFNSSAAEQVNWWFGKFLSIVREMEAVRYKFFLDEMIKQHNRIKVEDLREKGKAPYSIPRSFLLG